MLQQKIKHIKDVVNGESKNKLVHVLIYTLVGLSLAENMVVIFWHRPFSHLFLSGSYGVLNCLMDTIFIGLFLSTNTFVLILCTDMALTRIAQYQHPSPGNRAVNVGGRMPETWRHLALCYHLVSMGGLTSMLLLGMYGMEFNRLGLSVGITAALYGLGMASVTMMLLGGLVLVGCALTVHKWKSSIKRCSSICLPQASQRIPATTLSEKVP